MRRRDKSPARYFLGMTKTRFRMVRMMPEAFLIFFDGRRPNDAQSHLMPEIVREHQVLFAALAAHYGARPIPTASGAAAGRGRVGCPSRLEPPDRRRP
jgi:hypothetical protein